MIIGWIGDFGSGKTGGMTWRLHQKRNKGSKVFTNYGLPWQQGEVSSAILEEMPDDLRDMAMGCDEIHVFLDSRSSGKGKQKRITYFILQTRKRSVELDYTTQSLHQVDRRLREHTDILISCQNLGCNKKDCPGGEHKKCGIKTCGYYRYKMFDGHSGAYIGKFYLFGPRDFYPLYDTEKVIKDWN